MEEKTSRGQRTCERMRRMPEQTASVAKDDTTRPDAWLAELADGRLAQRIAEAARMAMVSHMYQTAQAMQSSAEAEHSAQQA